MANKNVDIKDWKANIISQLQNRNKHESLCFQDLIALHNRLFENCAVLKHENLQLTIQNEKLRLEVPSSPQSGPSNTKHIEKIQLLEQKVLHQQEELTSLLRRKSEHTQQLIDQSLKLQEKGKQLTALEVSLADTMAINSTLRLDIQLYQNKIKDLEAVNQVVRDEHQALQLAFAALEEKLRKAQEENQSLVERLIRYKSKDADKMNEENENFVRKRQAKVQKELEEAAKDTRSISPDKVKDGAVPCFSASMPTKVSQKFDAHDGEVNAVKWSPSDGLVATGGADRKVRLWDVSKSGVVKSKVNLVGSSAAVMSLDFDSTGTHLLAASCDFASRVWTIVDQRVRHTLTGHSNKVMAAKFMGDAMKVVTGSYDRTLKIWDLRSKACVETKFAGSSCNDLVTWDGSGTTIISGHQDKRIRFWDTRVSSCPNDIVLQGRITSLDLSRDANCLLACVRDDSLKLLDLRMNQVVNSFCSDDFRVVCDWARAAFCPDGQHVAAGSMDGSIIVWSMSSSKVEHTLREHASPVIALAFHPYGAFMASVDKSKRAVLWVDI